VNSLSSLNTVIFVCEWLFAPHVVNCTYNCVLQIMELAQHRWLQFYYSRQGERRSTLQHTHTTWHNGLTTTDTGWQQINVATQLNTQDDVRRITVTLTQQLSRRPMTTDEHRDVIDSSACWMDNTTLQMWCDVSMEHSQLSWNERCISVSVVRRDGYCRAVSHHRNTQPAVDDAFYQLSLSYSFHA